MAVIATSEFLSSLEARYPPGGASTTDDNPWYIIAAVAFSGANKPDEVPRVLMHALQGITDHEERLRISRRVKDAVFEAGMLTGYAKAINSLLAVHNGVPEDLRETQPLRRVDQTTIPEYSQRGETVFGSIYGETAQRTQGMLEAAFPDLGWFVKVIAYGAVYRCDGILSQVETSYLMISALISTDVARQAAWHLAGAQRGGATLAQVKAVREIAIEVSKASGVEWKNEIPEVV